MKALSFSLATCIVMSATSVTAVAEQLPQQQGMMIHHGASDQPSAVGQVLGPNSTGEPGVPVEIAGPQGRTYALTDQNGKWFVYNLPAGTYTARMAVGQTKDVKASFTVEQNGILHRWLGGAPHVNDVGTWKLELEPK